jgi:hypothetical protein
MRTNQYRNGFVQDAVMTKSSREQRQQAMKPRHKPSEDSNILRKGGAHVVPKRDKHSKRQIESALSEM